MSEPTPDLLSRLQRRLVASLVLVVIVTTIVSAAMILIGPDEEFAFRVIGSMCIVCIGLALNVAYVAVLRGERSPLVRSIVMIGVIVTPLSAAALFFGLMLRGDLDFDRDDTSIVRLGLAGISLAAGIAYTGALAQARDKPRIIRGMAIATGIAAWTVAGTMMFITLLFEWLDSGPNFGMAIALMIVFALGSLFTIVGTIAVPVALMSKAASQTPHAESIDPRVRVELGCPKCGERQSLRPGFATCAQCKAGLFIELEEPRCECGYLLYQLTGDICPECGRSLHAPTAEAATS